MLANAMARIILVAITLVACGADPGAPERPRPTEACFERTVDTYPCSGAVRTEAELEQLRRQVVVCDLCTADSHCTERAGGRCELLPGDTCEEARRVCVYPGDPCHDPRTCEGGTLRCMHREGRPVCADPAVPPP